MCVLSERAAANVERILDAVCDALHGNEQLNVRVIDTDYSIRGEVITLVVRVLCDGREWKFLTRTNVFVLGYANPTLVTRRAFYLALRLLTYIVEKLGLFVDIVCTDLESTSFQLVNLAPTGPIYGTLNYIPNERLPRTSKHPVSRYEGEEDLCVSEFAELNTI